MLRTCIYTIMCMFVGGVLLSLIGRFGLTEKLYQLGNVCVVLGYLKTRILRYRVVMMGSIKG
jgi:hypothetical protein